MLISCNIHLTCIFSSIRFLRYCGVLLLQSLSNIPSFLYQSCNWTDSKLNYWQSFYFGVLRIAPVMASQALYWMNSSFWWRDILYAWSKGYYHDPRLNMIKVSYIVMGAAIGRRFCNLWRIPIVLLISPDTIFRWSSNFKWL